MIGCDSEKPLVARNSGSSSLERGQQTVPGPNTAGGYLYCFTGAQSCHLVIISVAAFILQRAEQSGYHKEYLPTGPL